jgi:molybdate transport system substrate-binding protein
MTPQFRTAFGGLPMVGAAAAWHSGAVVPLRRLLPVLLCAGVVACGGGGSAPTGTSSVTLFAAASMAKVMAAEISAFTAAHPTVHVAGDYEGTQALLTKLEADPSLADVFVSADRRHMDDAVSRGIAAAPRDLAFNRLVVAVAPGNPGHIGGVADLTRPGLRLVLADTSVPAGSYAEQALALAESNHDAPAGFAAAVLGNVVSREVDVEAVVAKVAGGVADAGIVYATDAQASSRITAVPIAQRDQPVTVYPVAVTTRTHDRTSAQQFVDFLLSAQGQRILRESGFASPAPTANPLGGAGPSTP